jgi:hypothetical protein
MSLLGSKHRVGPLLRLLSAWRWLRILVMISSLACNRCRDAVIACAAAEEAGNHFEAQVVSDNQESLNGKLIFISARTQQSK